MKTRNINKPVFILSARRFRQLSGSAPAQRDSRMSILGVGPIGLMGPSPVIKNAPAQPDSGNSKLGVLGILRSLGILGWKTKSKTTLPQQGSGMSNLGGHPTDQLAVRLVPRSGDLTKQQPTPVESYSGMSNLRVDSENTPTQRDSEMSNLGMGLIGPMGPIGLMGGKPEKQTSPAQRDSGMSNLKISPYCPYSPYRPLDLENGSAQLDSGISKLGVLGILRSLGWKTKTSPAQPGSDISILGIGQPCLTVPTSLTKLQPTPVEPYSIISNLKVESENTLPQPESMISNLKICPYCPYRPYRPLDLENGSAQLDSGISKLGVLGILRSLGILGWKTKTSPAQQDSIISNLKVESENTPPQRDSIISNFGFCPFCPYCLFCPLAPEKSTGQSASCFQERIPDGLEFSSWRVKINSMLS